MKKQSFLVKWAEFFVRRYRITILLLIGILIAGTWGVANNQRQDFPNINVNIAIVSAIYPGASPENVEQEVVIPIEQAITNLDGVDKIRSSAYNSFGSIIVYAEKVSDVDQIVSDTTEEINKLGLPQDVDVQVSTESASGPTMALGIVGDNGQDTNELLKYSSDVKSRLEASSPEVNYIDVIPANEFEVQVIIDGEKLNQNRLNFEAVKGAVQSQITALPGGNVETSEGRKEAITIKAPAKSMEDLENISLGIVKLGDVAELKRLPKNSETNLFIGYVKDGEAQSKEAVYLLVYKNENGDVVRLADGINEEVKSIKEDGLIPDDIDIVTGYDISPYVNDQINSLLNNGYLGLILILIVLMFFINLRTAIVVALMIPIVFLVTLFVMPLLGYSLNILTLFAMILTLGILVDNAIVIAEGMVAELERGKTKKQAALLSIKKLGPAVLTATLTTVVVFIPFASIDGIMGDFLKYIPYTIMIVISTSFLVAISITPLMGIWLLKEETYEQRRDKKLKNWQKMLILPAIIFYGQNLIDKMSRGYKKMMTAIYKKWMWKIGIIVLVTVLFGVSFGVFAPMLEFEQFPSRDGNTILTTIEFPSGTTFAEKKDVFKKINDEIVQLDYFQTFYSYGNMIFGIFVDPEDRTDETTIYDIEEDLQNRIVKVKEGINEDIDIKAAASSYGPPTDSYDVIVEFLGNDRESLAAAADDLIDFVSDKEGVDKIVNGVEELKVPSVEVDFNQDELNRQGVSALIAAGTVNAIFAPQNAGSIKIRVDGITDDVVLEFSSSTTDSIDDLKNLSVPSVTGSVVKLSAVADVKSVDNPEKIDRLDGRRTATINIALTEDADSAKINNEINDYLTEDKLKELGLENDGVSYGGIYSEFEGDYANLQIVFLLAVLAVYLILVYQFHTYFQPALILMAVPLALIGVFPGLFLTGSTLNMISGLGVIALVGIVVNDAIVFISTHNRVKKDNPDKSMSEVLAHAGHMRFKPIFSTSITTIMGILPLTIIDPFWTGLGVSIISGLVFSTAGTLIAMPVLYMTVVRIMDKIRQKKEKSEIV
ncbi:MAG: efflux RND transporter permease subunit [bacterium]